MMELIHPAELQLFVNIFMEDFKLKLMYLQAKSSGWNKEKSPVTDWPLRYTEIIFGDSWLVNFE